MALRKAKIKEQMDVALREQLEPGEQVVAEGLCQGGPSPWWALLSLWLVVFLIKMYYVAVTDRRVIFLNVSRWSGRPQGVLRADPRAGAAIESAKQGTIWNPFVYRSPDGSTKKLRFHRIWRDEMGGVLQALSQAPAPQPAQQPDGFTS